MTRVLPNAVNFVKFVILLSKFIVAEHVRYKKFVKQARAKMSDGNPCLVGKYELFGVLDLNKLI